MVLGAAVVAEGAALGAAAAAESVFKYNRKNFLYDRDMRLDIEFAVLEFRIEQARLWREDVEDITELTGVKMDTYLIVNVVQLFFCVMIFCEGEVDEGTPSWVINAYVLSLGGAFLFLLMSVWLSVLTTVTAKAYQVRLLTQLVRLPVPSWSMLEGCRTYGSNFEKVDPKQMFRVPFVLGRQEQVLGISGVDPRPPGVTVHEGLHLEGDAKSRQSADPWGLESPGDGIYELDPTNREEPQQLRHIRLVQEAMKYWQAYDGFSRVSMSLGSNLVCDAILYYCLMYVLVSYGACFAACCVVLLFISTKIALVRLDMTMTSFEFWVAIFFLSAGPLCMTAACLIYTLNDGVDNYWSLVLEPIAFFLHAFWLCFLFFVSNVQMHGEAWLPSAWRSVLYIDIWGWLKKTKATVTKSTPVHGSAWEREPLPIVHYNERGLPVPTRPETLPGASFPLKTYEESKDHFLPESFVPRERAGLRHNESESRDYGSMPWRVFKSALLLQIVLWLLSGVVVLGTSLGSTSLDVYPLLSESVEAQEQDALEGHTRHIPRIERYDDAAEVNFRERQKLYFGRITSKTRNHRDSVGAGVGRYLTGDVDDTLLGLRKLSTVWPHAVHITGLACSANDLLVASSQFGIFKSNVDSSARFEEVPCADIEGESIQDVDVVCDDEQHDHCHAMALYARGRRLAACNVTETIAGDTTQRAIKLDDAPGVQGVPASAEIARSWQREHGESAEEVTSVVFDSCHGGHFCGFILTSENRVEVARATGTGVLRWVPERQVRDGQSGSRAHGGALVRMGSGFLGVLQQGVLEVLDQNGSHVGVWALPENVAWGSVCAAGERLYLLDTGLSPQLWEFQLPEVLSQPMATLGTKDTVGSQPSKVSLRSAVISDIGDVEPWSDEQIVSYHFPVESVTVGAK